MKKLWVLSFFLLSGLLLAAQDFEVPVGYSFKNKDDYARYEKDIIAASNWLFATKADKEEQKRKLVSKFVAEWVLGSPTVNAELSETIMDFEKTNPGMMALYFAACAEFVLENNYSPDIRAKHRFAMNALANFYRENRSLNKDKKMKELISEAKNGRLDEWIITNIPLRD